MSQLSLEEEEGRDHHTHQNQTPQGETHADEEPDIETADVNKETGTDKCVIILSKRSFLCQTSASSTYDILSAIYRLSSK